MKRKDIERWMTIAQRKNIVLIHNKGDNHGVYTTLTSVGLKNCYNKMVPIKDTFWGYVFWGDNQNADGVAFGDEEDRYAFMRGGKIV